MHPLRAAFALLVAWYLTAYVRRPGAYLLLDHVDLAVHEAGHVVFAPFGEFLGVAGGSLLQLIVPAAFVLYFLRTRNLDDTAQAVWALAIVGVPVMGAVAFAAIGPGMRRA